MASVSSAVDQAASLLKDRIDELEGELAKLQRALSNLTDGRQGRRGPGRPKARRRAARRRGAGAAAGPAPTRR